MISALTKIHDVAVFAAVWLTLLGFVPVAWWLRAMEVLLACAAWCGVV